MVCDQNAQAININQLCKFGKQCACLSLLGCLQIGLYICICGIFFQCDGDNPRIHIDGGAKISARGKHNRHPGRWLRGCYRLGNQCIGITAAGCRVAEGGVIDIRRIRSLCATTIINRLGLATTLHAFEAFETCLMQAGFDGFAGQLNCL